MWGRLSEHEEHFGDKHLPRSRLPRVGNAMLERFQAARRNVLLLGALSEHSGKGQKSKAPSAAVSREQSQAQLHGAYIQHVTEAARFTFT